MAPKKNSNITSSFDWTNFICLCKKYWIWFAVSAVVCCGLGVLKYKLTTPMAVVCAKVLVSEDSSKGSGGLAAMMSKQFDLGNMLGGTGSVYNEMQVMGSHTVFENTVKDLDLNSFNRVKLKFFKPWVSTGDKAPIILEYDKSIADTLGVALAFSIDVAESGNIDYKVKKGWRTLASGKNKTLPCLVETAYGAFTLTPTVYFPKGKSFKEKMTLVSYSSAAESYEDAVKINVMSKKVDVVGYSMLSDNPEFAKKILTTLIDEYNEAGVRQKQLKGEMTGEFLANRMEHIASDLNAQEALLQTYKQDHGLTLVEQDAKLAFTQAKTLRNQLVSAEAELEIMRLVRSFIEDPVNNHSLVPSLGDGLGAASTAITAYNEIIIERMALMNNARENNAAIKLIDEQLNAMRGNIKLSIDRGLETYEARLAELKKEVAKAESQLGAVPATEREYIGMERNRAVQEKLYLYLLQQQEENAMRMEISLPRGVVVDTPYISGEPVGLSLSKMLALSFVLGLCIPGGILFVKERMRRKVATVKEIKDVVKSPILADFDSDDSEYDMLAANVRCMLSADDDQNVVLVTSSNNQDGKANVAYGLAKTLGKGGNKVALAELDLRCPELAKSLGLPSATTGVVQYIVENMELGQVGCHQDGLYVIPAGTSVPNPAELTMSKKIKLLIDQLSKQFDYVVIDSAPTQNIPDTLNVSKNVAATVYVCGIGTTDVDYLNELARLISDNKLVNVGLVINKKS